MEISEHLYGETLEVQILKKMRDEKNFPTRAELSRQMGLDVQRARELVSDFKWPEKSILT